MSDEVNVGDEDVEEVDESTEAKVVDVLNESIDHEHIFETDDLDNLDDVHAQAAANRRAMAPYGDDPTIVTAGTQGIAPPGPGPDLEDLGIPEGVASPVTPSPRPEGPAEEKARLAEGGEVDDDEEVDVAQVESDYDPGAYTVADVNQYIIDHPDEADAVLAAEAAGKNRAGIVG